MTSRCRMCPVSDHLRGLALFCHRSASAASRGSFHMGGDTTILFTWWHWWPMLGDGVVVCKIMLCARHFVLALWLCLQI